MFKKFKDKLAEEVKSSPQRLQQFAQAAQAAVTSASSSISDITNNDLFSIGDSDSATKSQSSSNSQQSTFRDASPVYQTSIQSGSDLGDATILHEDSQRQRRLSNSSFASDVSFRLPSYESPSMYHLQSDMEVSASEAEEKGFNGNIVNLDRVTKEQLYSAYRHTQDRCKKYKTQYADLARHYKLLERENAKARNVLVETQDKALRRISELREQCLLEQSAKAHLERALRIEIEEKNMKIHALNTKLDFMQNNPDVVNDNNEYNTNLMDKESDMHLINLNDNEQKVPTEESLPSEFFIMNTKLEKMEQLLNKYKESLKVSKEKNAQMTTEIQILSNDLQAKSKEIEDFKGVSVALADSMKKIQELNDTIEELQNKCNSYDFAKNKETSILEINLQSAHEDILQLQSKIEELKKKEEEYAISLAENKLSIHKELESKESEIKSLKDSLSGAQNEIQSLNIIINDYKNNVTALESERLTLKSDINELNITKIKIKDTETQLEELLQKCNSIESTKLKLDEQYKCLQLQMKQETAEKLAMIDRNTYLEGRNAQLTEENIKKSSQITDLENELVSYRNQKDDRTKEIDANIIKEINMWKTKYENLEKEIQEERVELVTLQSEIEKLLHNYDLVQTKNDDLININSNLKKEIVELKEQAQNTRVLKKKYNKINEDLKELREVMKIISDNSRSCVKFVNNEIFHTFNDKMSLFSDLFKQESDKYKERYNELNINYALLQKEMSDVTNKLKVTVKELSVLKEENNACKLMLEQSKCEIIDMENKIRSAAVEHKGSLEEIVVLQQEIENLNNSLENYSKSHINVDENLKSLELANLDLQNQLAESEKNIKLLNTHLSKEKVLCEEKMQNAERQYEDSLRTVTGLKEEIDNLKKSIDDYDKHSLSQAEIIEALELKNRNIDDKLKDNENCIQLLNKNLKEEKDLYKVRMEEFSVLFNNYTTVLKDNEEKKTHIHKLEENIKNLTQENLTLKNLAESISDNVNKLEYEINEVRLSHTEIEKEKDHLNAVIDQLEKNQIQQQLIVGSDKDSQTNFINCEKQENDGDIILSKERSPNVDENITSSESTEVKVTIQNVQNAVKSKGDNYIVTDIEQKYNILQNEYETHKEENRRLQSDVEGLQIYLTKISNENSALNDKLREYFASGENLPEKNEGISNDIRELKSEVEYANEKIDNLTRENTILIEENLELKDQIQSQSYINHNETNGLNVHNDNTDQELKSIKEKYKSLLEAKTNLEKRLLEVEQMNQSVTENMQYMQVNNEKLRLSNEKLERRLDEALVSLRHLHALQENTELEYLRNILYEYLTGSGTHSLTLAKVLSAVVKFNDSQTDLVLQKERERQGFLRQLGLL